MRGVRRLLIVVLGGLLLGAWGCGDGTPAVESSRTEATVTGTVKVHGKAATRGTVTFDPSNVRRKDALPRTATISKDGTYSITTLIGENSVTVDAPETARDPKLSNNMEQYVVKGGTNAIDIELPQPQP